MNRPVVPSGTQTHQASVLSTVLDRVRPTVVVRRRVYDVPAAAVPVRPKPQTLLVAHATDPHDNDDDNGPPSSVNVGRALRSLRADELHRVEEIMSADDDTPSPPPSLPAVRVGKTIALAELAAAMSVPKQELVTALVTCGFFSVTVKTVLPRETARLAAAMFKWRVEDYDDTLEVAVAPRKNASASPEPSKAKPGTKKKPPPSKKLATKKSPSKKLAITKTARKTSRGR